MITNVVSFDIETLLDLFAIFAPEPARDVIIREMEKDRLANPHNDSYKPRRRSEAEVIAELKYQYASHMLEARRKAYAIRRHVAV